MQIAVALFDRFTALDAVGPYEVLVRLPGATVTFVAERTGEHRTDTGSLGAVADATFDDLPNPDVVVVPGGPGTRALLDPASTLASWVRAAHEHTTWTTSVCTGSLVLAAAGLLDGLDATTHWAAADLLGSLGASYSEARVVAHAERRLITAAGVSSGIDMALALAAHLAGDDVARAIQLGIEYDPQPPFDAGSPAKAGPELVALLRDLAIEDTPPIR